MQKIIKSEVEYESALRSAERLIVCNPRPTSPEADELELLSLLIEDYERRTVHIDAADPITAIEFRMEQQGLRQKDLVPIIGSRSRVSEVLSGKRPLTIQMIRSLASSLGIPLSALVAEPQAEERASTAIDYSKLPLNEIVKRGWLGRFAKTPKRAEIEQAVAEFLSPFTASVLAKTTYRRTLKADGFSDSARSSAIVWCARIALRAQEAPASAKYHATNLNSDALGELARLSWFDDGPLRAIGFLRDLGITVVVESPLPRSLVDGAALLLEGSSPVIGLSLRYDRLDYFWFTLLHEVAHVWRHLNVRGDGFVDRLEGYETSDRLEREANKIAQEAFIPQAIWHRCDAYLSPSARAIHALAGELHIHPAIVAGRIHHESKNYAHFRNLLGQGLVRNLLQEMQH